MVNRKTLAYYQVKDPRSGKSPQPNKHSIVSRQPQDITGEVIESMPEMCSDHSRCLRHDAISELAPFAPERINIGITSLLANRLKSVFLARFPGVAKQKSPTLSHSCSTTTVEFEIGFSSELSVTFIFSSSSLACMKRTQVREYDL